MPRSQQCAAMTSDLFTALVRASRGILFQLACAAVVTLCWQPVQATAGDDLAAALADLDRTAVAARRSRDFALVEEQRLGRLELLAGAADESPWARGFLALGKADELIATMKYRECCELLRETWKPFASSTEGVVFGDIAVKMFECCMAAQSIHPDCLDDDNADRIATHQELLTAITTAAARDSCATEAGAALAYLTRPDPREAFLRAEVRPSIQARNRQLLAIAAAPDPLLPWSGAAELLKAQSTTAVLGDLVYLPTFLEANRQAAFTGWDAHHNPVHLIYGRLFLMLLPGEGQQMTPHAVYVDSKGAWRRAILRIVRYGLEDAIPLLQPATAMASNSGSVCGGPSPGPAPAAAPAGIDRATMPAAGSVGIARILDVATPISEFAIGATMLRLHEVPPERMVDAVTNLPIIGVDRWQTIVTAAKTLAKNPALHTDVPPGPALLLPQPSVRQQWFLNSLDAITKDIAVRRPTASVVPTVPIPLDALRLFLVVCDPPVRENFEPPFLKDDQQRSFVPLADGRRLLIDAARGVVEIDSPTAKACMPMQLSKTPLPLIMSTDAGKKYMAMLASSGYSRQASLDEFSRAVADPAYVPSKLAAAWARARKGEQPAGAATNQAANADPMTALREVYQSRGFRHLISPRQEFISAPTFIPVDGGAAAATPTEGNDASFRILTAQGDEADQAAIYTTTQYRSLYKTLFMELLPQAAALHPCLPIWTAIDQARTQLEALPFVAQPVATATPAPPPAPPPPPPPVPADTTAEPKPIVIDTGKLAKDLAAWHMEAFLPGPPPAGAAVIPAERIPAALSSLLSLYHEEARRQFVGGNLHRSAVLYQDIGRRLATVLRCDPRLQASPDQEQLADFTQAIVTRAAIQDFEIIVRGEQSCILDAAGLHPAAEHLRRSLIDRVQLGTLPLIEQIGDTARGVGLHPAPELTSARERIETLLAHIASLRLGDATAAKRAAMEPPDLQAAAVLEKIRAAVVLRSGEKPGKPTDNDAVLDDLVEELHRCSPSIGDWCAEKAFLCSALPEHLVTARTSISLETFCPATVTDRSTDYRRSLRQLLPDGIAARLQQWLALPTAEAAAHPDAGVHNFLLGWFWLERGNETDARTAFMAGARAFEAIAARDRTQLGLSARRNAIFMALGASSIVESQPAALGLQGVFLEDLRLQMLLWKRQWSLLGQSSRDAQRESDRLGEGIAIVRSALQRQDMRDANRYYFFDYRFQYGAVPDTLFAAVAEDRPYSEGHSLLPRANFKQPEEFDEEILASGTPSQP